MSITPLLSVSRLGRECACDTETTGLDPWHGARPFAVGFCDMEGNKAFYRGAVDPKTRKVTWPEQTLRLLCEVFGDPNRIWVFHNMKFDVYRMLNSINIRVTGRCEDTVYAAHVWNSGEPSFGLKPLSIKYLKYPATDQDRLKAATHAARRKAKKFGWALGEETEEDYWMAQPQLLRKYCLGDVERTALLWLMYKDLLNQHGDELWSQYRHELDLLREATVPMEVRGTRLRWHSLLGGIKKHQLRIKQETVRIEKAAPGLNINSPKQLSAFLYGKLGLTPTRFTDKGHASCDGRALEKMQHPIAKAISRKRASEKALGTFLIKYRDLSVPDTITPNVRVLHPDFLQTGTITGRFSCRKPNLMQVASTAKTKSTEPIEVKDVMGPRPGYVWWLADFSQLEIRIFADRAQEQFMIEALLAGRNLHTEVTNKIWGGKDNPLAIKAALKALELEQFTAHTVTGIHGPAALIRQELLDKFGKKGDHEKMARAWLDRFAWDIVKAEASVEKETSRSRCKQLQFCKIYGGGAEAAAEWIGCSKEEAQGVLDDYDDTFPGIKRYMRRLASQAERDGYIVNAYGRRIAVDPEASYKSVNYMVQSSAASLVKDRMLAVARWTCKRKLPIHLLLQIHDELILEVRKDLAWNRPLLTEFKSVMEAHGGHFSVPLPVELAITTRSWLDEKKLKLEDVPWQERKSG